LPDCGAFWILLPKQLIPNQLTRTYITIKKNAIDPIFYKIVKER